MSPVTTKRLPFFEHFAELRRRITLCVIVLVILTMLGYIEPVFHFLSDLLLDPVRATLPNGGKLYTQGPFEAMTVRFQLGFYGALVATSPLILYQFFAFFTPALKSRERRWIFPTLACALVLFLGGVAFAYFVIMPQGFAWLAEQGAGITQALPRAPDYFSGIGMLLIGFGLSFELPLVVFYLIGTGILPYQRVRDSWRVAYVIIVVVAAIATPDWSPYPMFGLSAALILLFEASLFAARLIFWRRIAEQAIDAYEDQQLYENDPSDDPEVLKRRERLYKRAEAARQRLDAFPRPQPEESPQEDEESDVEES